MGVGGRASNVILVADSDTSARAGLSATLSGAGYEVEQVSGGAQAMQFLQAFVPSLVILEPCLPDISGYEVCNQLRLRFGDDLPVIFVSAHRTEACDRVAGLLIGADDYLVQPVAPDELLARVRRLLRKSSAPVTSGHNANGHLTLRELQILELLSDGLTQKEIAAKLFISAKTVGTHVEHILSKLGVGTRAHAVAVAYQRGLLNSQNRKIDLRTDAAKGTFSHA